MFCLFFSTGQHLVTLLRVRKGAFSSPNRQHLSGDGTWLLRCRQPVTTVVIVKQQGNNKK